MSVLITGSHEISTPTVCLFDDTEGIAFGPTFETVEQAEDFLRWLADGIRAARDEDFLGNVAHGRHIEVAPARWKSLHSKWFDERVDGETGDVLEGGESDAE